MPLILSGSNGLSGNVGNVTKDMMPAGSVLQVVQALKQDNMSSTLTGWQDIPGLTASITPNAASNKVLVIAKVNGAGGTGATHIQLRLLRNGVEIGSGNADGSNTPCFAFLPTGDNGDRMLNGTAHVLDTPASTAAVTYKVQYRNNNSTSTIYINRGNGAGTPSYPLGASEITLMEIKA
jgi:hypothetical protein